MLAKLFKTTRLKADPSGETPSPDLSRILKPSAVKVERPSERPVPEQTEAEVALESAVADSTPQLDHEGWLKRDIESLKQAFDAYTQRVSSAEARRQLFIASHNLRGIAEPFGNPVLGRLAASLCTLLERSPSDEPVVALANLHVEAMRAAVAIGPGAATDKLAQTVCVALEDQVNARLESSGR